MQTYKVLSKVQGQQWQTIAKNLTWDRAVRARDRAAEDEISLNNRLRLLPGAQTTLKLSDSLNNNDIVLTIKEENT